MWGWHHAVVVPRAAYSLLPLFPLVSLPSSPSGSWLLSGASLKTWITPAVSIRSSGVTGTTVLANDVPWTPIVRAAARADPSNSFRMVSSPLNHRGMDLLTGVRRSRRRLVSVQRYYV